MTNIDPEKRKVALSLLKEMNRDAEEMGVNTEYAKRFVRAGEDALAVREFFHIADRNFEFKKIWRDELDELNVEYAKISYFQSRMGYPLQWSIKD